MAASCHSLKVMIEKNGSSHHPDVAHSHSQISKNFGIFTDIHGDIDEIRAHHHASCSLYMISHCLDECTES
jgi:hypothetical protein